MRFCLDHIVEKLRMAEEKTSAQMLVTNGRPRQKSHRFLIARLQYSFGGFFREDGFECGRYALAPNLTDTSFETPGSCIVTPYITGATLMVFLLWVMSTN